MHKHSDHFDDNLDSTDNNDNDEDIIWVSKSEIKRDAKALRDLGVELVQLGKNALGKLPLDDQLRQEIELAQRIKKEGLRRQLQLIGKLLRNRDVSPIQQALDKLKNRHNQQVADFHRIEALREQLITEGDQALNQLFNHYPEIDRQQLRTLLRNVQKEREQNKPPKSYRQLFTFLQQVLEKHVD